MAATSAALTVRRNFPRLPTTTLDRFANASSGWIVDANGRRGALDWHIRPLTKATRFVGTALTVHSRARDNLAPYAALAYAQPGDVLVIATDCYEEASAAGDVLLGMARNAGIVALVTDGMVRDIDGLNAVGIPVFAHGLTPNSPHKDGPGEIGLPIAIGGVIIDAGDVIVGDQDGVVVVARAMAEAIAKEIDAVAAKEKAMDGWVRDGAKVPPWLESTVSAKGVHYVE
jgi:4-hydroxy-4-methyl-2-oxoglutarate aldolase